MFAGADVNLAVTDDCTCPLFDVAHMAALM